MYWSCTPLEYDRKNTSPFLCRWWRPQPDKIVYLSRDFTQWQKRWQKQCSSINVRCKQWLFFVLNLCFSFVIEKQFFVIAIYFLILVISMRWTILKYVALEIRIFLNHLNDLWKQYFCRICYTDYKGYTLNRLFFWYYGYSISSIFF